MASSPRRDSKRDDSHRASSIELELEQLLSLGFENDEIHGSEALKDRTHKSKKIQYKHRTDDSKETIEDTSSKKSARSKRSRASKASSGSTKESTDEFHTKDCIKRTNSRGSKSPKSNRNAKKIQYRSKEPETAEERDRDARSHRSRDSKGSRVSRRSGHRKSKNGVLEEGGKDVETNRRKSALLRSKRASHRKRGNSPDSNEDKDLKYTRSTSKRNSSSKEKGPKRKSWSFDDFESNEWSSSEDDEEIEVRLNDEGVEGVVGLNDKGEFDVDNVDNSEDESRLVASSGGDRKDRPRRRSIREKEPLLRRRNSHTGGFEAKGNSSSRRNSRRFSGTSAINADMILGDPSRRAPPSRSKSNILFSSLSRHKKGDRKVLPGEDDNDNPFEVIQSYNTSDNWDPFVSGNTAEEKLDDTKERRGTLRQTKSGGLLQTSSKDTISRLRIGANFRKDCTFSNMSILAGASGDLTYAQGNLAATTGTTSNYNEPGEVFKSEREKQRRADYKKSIAAAAMAGRLLSKPSQRQVRTVRSSFEESVKQLEGALAR